MKWPKKPKNHLYVLSLFPILGYTLTGKPISSTRVISLFFLLRPEPLEDIANSKKKRLFDIIFSLLVIVFILSWLIPILAILIILTSRGHVFFKQAVREK